MKTIELDVVLQYKDLVEIFFNVNGLFNMGFVLDVIESTYQIPVNVMINNPGTTDRQYESTKKRKVLVCIYDEDNIEQVKKIQSIITIHKSFNNMLHSFLNRCGIRKQQYELK